MSTNRVPVNDLDPNGIGICISNLNWWTNDQHLVEIFSKYGIIEDLKIFSNRHNGKSMGFAYIGYKNEDNAQTAKKELDGTDINGYKCRITFTSTGKILQYYFQRLDQQTRPFHNMMPSNMISNKPRR